METDSACFLLCEQLLGPGKPGSDNFHLLPWAGGEGIAWERAGGFDPVVCVVGLLAFLPFSTIELAGQFCLQLPKEMRDRAGKN